MILSDILPLFKGLTFERDGLNCFTAPKAVATSFFDPVSPYAFNAYVYFAAHYDALGLAADPDDMMPQPWSMDAIERVVLAKLGLELVSVRPAPDLAECVCEHIDGQQPVLVPIDKTRLFYYAHARDRPAASLLLVKGYQEDSRVLIIQDCIQSYHLLDAPVTGDAVELRATVGDLYTQFYLTDRLLSDAFDAYRSHYRYLDGHVQVLRRAPRSDPGTTSPGRVLADLAAVVTGASPSGVEQLVRRKLEWLDRSVHSDLRHTLVFVNSQRILPDAIAHLTPSVGDGEPRLAALTGAVDRARAAWQGYATAVATRPGERPAGPRFDRLAGAIHAAEEKVFRLLREVVAPFKA